MSMFHIRIKDTDGASDKYAVLSGTSRSAVTKVLKERYPDGDLPDELTIKIATAQEGLILEEVEELIEELDEEIVA